MAKFGGGVSCDDCNWYVSGSCNDLYTCTKHNKKVNVKNVNLKDRLIEVQNKLDVLSREVASIISTMRTR
jgi:hypothetical protein